MICLQIIDKWTWGGSNFRPRIASPAQSTGPIQLYRLIARGGPFAQDADNLKLSASSFQEPPG